MRILSGADPEGIFPSVLGHEGAGIVVEVGGGVRSRKPGDHVTPLYTTVCRNCRFCLSEKTNLCRAIRVTQGQGLMPDGMSRLSGAAGAGLRHYMGTSTFASHAVLPKLVDWYMDDKLQIGPLTTHRRPLAEIDEAFELMHAVESIRTVLHFD